MYLTGRQEAISGIANEKQDDFYYCYHLFLDIINRHTPGNGLVDYWKCISQQYF